MLRLCLLDSYRERGVRRSLPISSLGSSVSSQGGGEMGPGQLGTPHGGAPLGRMKSQQGTSSSQESIHDNSNGVRMVLSGGDDGTIRATGINSPPPRTELGSSSHGPRFVADLSNSDSDEPPTWSEFLKESSPLPTGMD